ncbi:MAG: hypothetical protein ACM3XP_03195 [Nitrososphaerales archaeon]
MRYSNQKTQQMLQKLRTTRCHHVAPMKKVTKAMNKVLSQHRNGSIRIQEFLEDN